MEEAISHDTSYVKKLNRQGLQDISYISDISKWEQPKESIQQL